MGRGAGSMAALEESMGRGRGRGMSNLPAWMTKAKAKPPPVPGDDATARVRTFRDFSGWRSARAFMEVDGSHLSMYTCRIV